MDKKLETPKKESTEIHTADLEAIIDAPKLSEFNQRVLRHVIEEALRGDFDRAERILAQKRLVEMNQDKNHRSRLPSELFEKLIPIIKDYMHEKGLLKHEPSEKQLLTENLKNIESKTLPPNIQNVVQNESSDTIHSSVEQNKVKIIHIPETKTKPKNPIGEIVDFEEVKDTSHEEDPDILAYKNRPENLDILSAEYQDLLKKSIEARERRINQTKKIIEHRDPKEAKSQEFLILERDAQREKTIYGKELARDYKNDPNNENVLEFDKDPYGWIQKKIKRKIRYAEEDLEKATRGKDKEFLLGKIISLKNRLYPIQYMIKKDEIFHFKDDDILLITENGNTVKYKIVSINSEKVRFHTEGQALINSLSYQAMKDFLLNPAVSFIKEKIHPEQKGAKKNSEKTKNTPLTTKTPDAQTENIDTSNEKPVAVTEDTSKQAMESGGTEDEKTPNTEKKSKEDILREAKEKIQEIEKKYVQKREETIDQFFKKK